MGRGSRKKKTAAPPPPPKTDAKETATAKRKKSGKDYLAYKIKVNRASQTQMLSVAQLGPEYLRLVLQ